MTTTQDNGICILMADDDDDDFLLTKKALKESRLLNKLCRVKDGEELLQYLRHEGDYKDADHRRPGVILLDLNMPRLDGRAVLRAVKTDSRLRRIPVVVFSTSSAEEDIRASYDLGANSYITKPMSYDGLIAALRSLEQYWFDTVAMPVDPPTEPQ